MCRRRFVALAAAVLGGALWMLPATAWADLTPYSQDFEGMELATAGSTALSDDGWLVFGNVYAPGGGYLYGYGPFPAPNDGAAFCAVVTGQGGVPQGDRQLSVFSDYNNGDHGNGNLIESNVFQEQTVGAADVGSTWTFEFDAKLGNLVSPSTAAAFIKTLDPGAGYALTNFVTADMTTIPTTWDTYSVSLAIDATLPGQIFQFGFLNVATNYDGSGVFYDNVSFTPEPTSLAVLALGGLALLKRRRR
jgi:hypothetical protein